MKKTIKNAISSLTAKLAALFLLAFGCAGSAWGAEPVTIQNERGANISVYEVSSGFYQSGTTYNNSIDFYITNLNGLKFFRDIVNGETAASYAYFTATGVTGTYPTTPAGIKSFHSNNMFSGMTVHLLADLDLAGEQWITIGFNRAARTITDPDTSASAEVSKCTFYGLFDAGIYDGEGNLTGTHVISNLDTSWQYVPEAATLQAKYQLTGLFGQLSGGTTAGVKNLTVRNATVVGRDSVGVIAGRSYNGGAKIENCHVVGNVNVSGTGTYIGGLVGECRASIVNSSVDAEAGSSISGFAYVGGLAGSVFQYNVNDSVEVSGSAVSNTAVNASYSGVAGVGALVGVTNPSGTYHGNVVISGNDANNVPVSAPNSSTSKGGVGTLVGNTLYDDGAYAIVADNTVSGTTSATAGGEAVTVKMGEANDNIAVGENATFDASGKVTGGIFEVINESLIASGYLATDNPDTTTSADYPLTIGGPYVAVIYDSDTGKFKQGFKNLADALSGAADGETITLISGPDEAISAKGEVTGGKTVTITGTAKFDWAPGWLFVGRGANAGDGTLIFKDATITRSSDQASYGLHISGKNKSSSTTNYGTLIITNSTIECDVLLNKGSITVYGKDPSVDVPDFEVFRGWGVGGRPASESVSGEHETATFTATDGAYIRLANHNGQGNGYEGNAVMSILNGSKFEYTGESFANGDNCTDGATGVINVDATSLLKMKAFQNLDNGNSSVVIDATGAAGGSKVIDLSGTKSLEGYVTVNNLVAPMTAIYDADGDVTLMSVAAIVNDSSDVLVGRYETLAEAVENYQDGYTIVVVDKTQTIPEGWMFKESGNVTTLVKAVAQIGTTKYETVEAALKEAEASGATIEILTDSIETPDHALEVLMHGDITLTAATPVRVEIAPTTKTSSVDNDGMAYIRSADASSRSTFTIGENVTLAFPATAVGKGAMYIGYSSATAADVVVAGRIEAYEPYVGSTSTLTVNPSGSIKSISECLIVRWGAAVNVVGTGADWSASNPQADFAYVSLQGGITTLKDTYAKGGAFVQIYDRNNRAPEYETKLVLDNSTLAANRITNQGVSVEMDVDSQIVTPVVANTGVFSINASGVVNPVKVIDYTGSGTMTLADYGTVNVTGGEAYVDDNDLWVKKLPVAQIGETKYETIAAAVAAASTGDTIQLIADADEDVSLATWKNNAITFDLGGHTLTGQIIAPYGAKTDGIVIRNGNIVGRDSSRFYCLQFGYGSGNATLENLSVTQTSTNYRSYAVFFQQTDKRVTMRNVTLDGRFYTANSGSTIAIESGVYKNSTGLSNADISNGGVVAAIGGTFYYNPTTPNNLVAQGYVATETTDADNVQCWVVELGPAFAKVTLKDGTETEFWDLDEAIGALAEGATLTIKPDTYTLASANYTLPKDVKIIGVGESGARVKITSCPTFNSANGLTIENVDFDGGYSWTPPAVTVHGDATFKNCTITGENAVYYSTVNGTLTFDGCTFDADTYALNIGEGTGDVIVKDCTISGWTSFGNVGKTIITGTTFEEGNYNYLRFYQDAVIDDCSFNNDMSININATGKKLIVSDSAFKNGSSVASAIGQGEDDDPPVDNYIAVGTRITTDEDGFVTGGVFDKIDDGIIADGYISVDNLDGETKEKYPLTVGGPFAAVILDQNGGFVNGYTSLAAAVEAVPVDGTETTIQLIANVELSATVEIPAEKNVVLDMNGKTISADGFADKVNVIVNKGTLTVQNGTIEVSNAVKKTYAILSNGDIIVNAVTINSNSGGIRVQGSDGGSPAGTIIDCAITVNTTANTTAHGVYASDGANVTIKSGVYSYTGPVSQDTVQACDDGTVLTIEGGTFTAALDSVSTPNATPKVLNNNGSGAVVYVKGGTFNGDLGASNGDVFISGGTFSINGLFSNKLAVSGGIFNFEVTQAMCAVGYSPAANTDAETKDAYPYTVAAQYEAHIVRNGEVVAGSGGALADVLAAAEAGDTVKLLADVTTSEIVFVDKSITLDGDGHKLITSAARGIRVTTANVDVTIKNLEIPYNSNVERGIQIDSDRDDVSLTLENVKAAGTKYAVVVIAGSDRPALTLKNVELTATYPVHIAIVDNPTLVIQNSQLEGYCAMELYGNEGTVTIEDSTLIGVNNASYNAAGWNNYGVIVIEGDTTGQTQNGASRYGITVKDTAIVVDSTNGNGQRAILYNIHSAENAITLENCTVELKDENCTFLCDNGADSVTKLKGTTVYGTENIPDLPEGYCYVDDGEYKLVSKAVAQIGNTGYASLADAIAAVPADGTETTITMIADEAVVAGVTIAAGQNVVLELNGKTVSGNTDSTKQYALITNKGTLTIQDNTDTNGDGTGTGLITTYISNPDTGDVPGYASNTISNYGKLTVKSGKIVNNGSGYACYAIDNLTNGNQYEPELDIQGGRMVQMNARTYAVRLFCNSTTKENKATISGGVIEGGYGLWVQTPNANANKATLTISGGTLNANDGAALYVGGTKADNSNISIVITDGEINGTGAIIQGPLSGTYKKVEISGGDIVNVQCGANVEDFISGGTFDNPVNEAYCADGYIPTDNGNGTYGVKQGNYVAQLMGDGYVAISANIDEPSEDVYLDMWSFWGMEGMVDANNNECPQYVSITDETLYRDTAVADANGDEAWVSAKYLYENYLASGKKYYASQTSLLYEEGEVIVAKFESLTEAVAAAQSGDTVQLLTNITLTAGVEVVKAQGGTFVLDGAGYTITAASPLSNSKIIAVYIEGKASDASAMQLDVKNLTIESDGLKYGFVLDSMQVAMSNVVVRANGGTAFCANTHASVTIDDCTIANTGSHTDSWRDTALAVSYMADVTVNSGTFTSENGWAAYIFTSGGTIDVKGGTFSGKVRSSADTVGENRGDATITISGGEFSNVELTTAHDSNLNATIAVSGGWFSAQVPAMACAEGFEPTGALADAPNAAVPYTVGYAADIVYPIEGTAGVRIALAWATNNTSVVSEGAPVTAADVPNIITALGENGANNMPRWQSYVLGLNPADPTAVLRLAATAKDATTVTITGAIDTTKFPSISNVTVTFRLAAQNGAEWTDIATGAATPSFDVALDDVAGKVLTIFADIVTK